MKGFTLVEILVAAALAVVFGGVLLGLLSNNTSTFYKQNSLVSSGVSLNDSLREMNNFISQGAFVAAGYPEISPTYTTSIDTLVVKLPSLGPSGTINNVYDFVVIARDAVSPAILRMQVFPDPQSSRPAENTVLTTLLKTIEFDYLDNHGLSVPATGATSVAITLTVISKTGAIGSDETSSMVSRLKNH